jgi:hypothetical protein
MRYGGGGGGHAGRWVPVSFEADSEDASNMVDSYSLKMKRTIADASLVWSELAVASEALFQAHPNAHGRGGKPWELRTSERSWVRSSLNELRDLAEEHSLIQFSADWTGSAAGCHWNVDVFVYDLNTHSVDLGVKAYAGNDRMVLEQACKAVADIARRRGVELVAGPTKISSVDEGPDLPDEIAQMVPVTTRPPLKLAEALRAVQSVSSAVESVHKTAPVRVSRGSRSWAKAETHLVTLIVTVVGTVIAAAIVLWLGLNA